MHSILNKVRNKEDILDLIFRMSIDFLVEKDGRFVEIGHLTRKLREI